MKKITLFIVICTVLTSCDAVVPLLNETANYLVQQQSRNEAEERIAAAKEQLGYSEVTQNKYEYFGTWEAVNGSNYPNLEILPKQIRFKDFEGNVFEKTYELNKGSGFVEGEQYDLYIDDYGPYGRTWWLITVENEGLDDYLYLGTGGLVRSKYKRSELTF